MGIQKSEKVLINFRELVPDLSGNYNVSRIILEAHRRFIACYCNQEPCGLVFNCSDYLSDPEEFLIWSLMRCADIAVVENIETMIVLYPHPINILSIVSPIKPILEQMVNNLTFISV